MEHNRVPTNEHAAALHSQPNRAHALSAERHVQTVHRVRPSTNRRVPHRHERRRVVTRAKRKPHHRAASTLHRRTHATHEHLSHIGHRRHSVREVLESARRAPHIRHVLHVPSTAQLNNRTCAAHANALRPAHLHRATDAHQTRCALHNHRTPRHRHTVTERSAARAARAQPHVTAHTQRSSASNRARRIARHCSTARRCTELKSSTRVARHRAVRRHAHVSTHNIHQRTTRQAHPTSNDLHAVAHAPYNASTRHNLDLATRRKPQVGSRGHTNVLRRRHTHCATANRHIRARRHRHLAISSQTH